MRMTEMLCSGYKYSGGRYPEGGTEQFRYSQAHVGILTVGTNYRDSTDLRIDFLDQNRRLAPVFRRKQVILCRTGYILRINILTAALQGNKGMNLTNPMYLTAKEFYPVLQVLRVEAYRKISVRVIYGRIIRRMVGPSTKNQ